MSGLQNENKPGVLPASPALAEANPGSLSELLSRDPEGYQRVDLEAMAVALRANREQRRLASELAASAATKRKGAKAPGAMPVPSAPPSGKSAEEMDL